MSANKCNGVKIFETLSRYFRCNIWNIQPQHVSVECVLCIIEKIKCQNSVQHFPWSFAYNRNGAAAQRPNISITTSASRSGCVTVTVLCDECLLCAFTEGLRCRYVGVKTVLQHPLDKRRHHLDVSIDISNIRWGR